MAVLKWDSVRAGLMSVNDAITAFINMIEGVYGRVRDLLGGKNAPLQVFPGGASRQPSSFRSLDGEDATRLFTPTRFDPGTDVQRTQQASFSLNIDGRTLAQSVIDHLESIYGLPTSAGAPDGMHSPYSDQYGA